MKSELENETHPYILLDSFCSIAQIGSFTGSIIGKLKPPSNEIIFSDNVELSNQEIAIKGLHVGVKERTAFWLIKNPNLRSHSINLIIVFKYRQI